jgi:hypothetical protein
MKNLLCVCFLFILAGAAFASPSREHAAKVILEKRKALKAEQASFSFFVLSRTPSIFDSSSKDLLFMRKFILNGNSNFFDTSNKNASPQLEEYLKVSKSASLGLTYPLSSKFILSGQYLFLTGQQAGVGQGEMQLPLFKALYRFSAKTSISITYKNINASPNAILSGSRTQGTTAELQVHF